MLTDIQPRGHVAVVKVAILLCALLLPGCALYQKQASPPPAVEARAVPPKNVTIAMLGATGLAGGYILDRALAEGYAVRALARSPQKLAKYGDRITIVEGDARDPASIATLLRGSEVVISALGPVKADGDAATMLNSSVTRLIVQRMPTYGIERYIALSGAAVVMPGDDRNLTGWLMRQIVLLTLNDTLRDKQAEYEVLAGSSVQWTLVRCPLIEAEPFIRPPRASLKTPTAFTLRAGELAEFVIEQISSREFIGKGPFLESR